MVLGERHKRDMAESAMATEDRGKDAALEAPAAKKPKTREAEELLYVMSSCRCLRLRFVGARRPEGCLYLRAREKRSCKNVSKLRVAPVAMPESCELCELKPNLVFNI